MSDQTLLTYRLFTLLQRVENGEIRIPDFQRAFGWNNSQILRLMESIYKGYPIGTFIFWETGEEVFETANSDASLFPDSPKEHHRPYVNTATYLIDGVQRLSCLYNCLRWKALDRPHKFNIVFDLDSKTFSQYRGERLGSNHVHLASVFQPQLFIQDRFKFDDTPDNQNLLMAVTDLRAKFIDYEIVIMRLAGYDASEIISIFELLNTTGRTLTRRDLERSEIAKKGFASS